MPEHTTPTQWTRTERLRYRCARPFFVFEAWCYHLWTKNPIGGGFRFWLCLKSIDIRHLVEGDNPSQRWIHGIAERAFQKTIGATD